MLGITIKYLLGNTVVMNSVMVKDEMSSPVETIPASDTVRTAAELMSKKNIGSLLVIDEENQRGIITERDIVRAIAHGSPDEIVRTYTQKPLITIGEDSFLGDAAQLMLSKKIRRLVVTNGNGQISGILSIRDITMAVHEKFLAIFDL